MQVSLGRFEEARESYLESAEIFQASKGFRRGALPPAPQDLCGPSRPNRHYARVRCHVAERVALLFWHAYIFMRVSLARRKGASTTQRLDGAIYASANAALMRAQLGDDAGALRDIEGISRRAPNSADMRAASAALLWGLGRAEEAEDAWQARTRLCGRRRALCGVGDRTPRSALISTGRTRNVPVPPIRRLRARATRGVSVTRTWTSSPVSAAGRPLW